MGERCSIAAIHLALFKTIPDTTALSTLRINQPDYMLINKFDFFIRVGTLQIEA